VWEICLRFFLQFSGIRQVALACTAPHLIHASLGPPESTTQTASRLVKAFLPSSWQSVVGMTWRVLPLKIVPSH